ncbi:MAG: TolC family protein [Vicinamibacterales bacterium]
MRRVVLVHGVMALVLAIPIGAQDVSVPMRLTLAEAIEIAEARNSQYRAAQSGLDIAEADRLEASARPNPAVSAEFENYPLFESSRPPFFEGQELTVRVDQEIETAGRRRLRIESATAGLDIARAQIADARRQLEVEVSRAYFELALAQADREVANAALAELERVIELSAARVKVGEAPGAELRRLQVERLRFVDDVFAADLAARNARAALLGLLGGADLQQPLEAVDPLDAAPVRTAEGQVIATAAGVSLAPGDLQTLAVRSRPDLQAAQTARDRSATETRRQRALRTPNVTVGGGYRRDFGTNAVVFGVTVPLPLFSSLNPGGVQRAEAEQRRADALAEAALRSVQVELQQAVNAVQINAERVAYIEREYLTNAQQSRDIVRASYELGAADLIDFLDAQRTYRETQRVRNRALHDLRITLIELAAAIGTPVS